MREAAAFFKMFLDMDVPRIAVENPVMHGYGLEIVGKPSFGVQPWQHGDPEKKRTMFWTKNLPPLESTNIVTPTASTVHNAAPNPDRSKLRSLTFPGIARAMAEQWGNSR